MSPLRRLGLSRYDRLRSAPDLYHTRVLSEVLVNQKMIMCGRPWMESKNATPRCGTLLRKCYQHVRLAWRRSRTLCDWAKYMVFVDVLQHRFSETELRFLFPLLIGRVAALLAEDFS